MSESKAKTAQDVYEIVLQLSSGERERLEVLMDKDGSSGRASPEIKQAWIDETDRRMQLIDAGKAGWVDGEQVMRDLRKSVAR